MRVLAYFLLVIAGTHAYLVCEPGDSTDDGETVCFCIGDGLGWICAPTERRARANIEINRQVTPNDETCEPGTYFKNDCNTCHCGFDGRKISSVCTMMDCEPNVWNKNGALMAPVLDSPLSDDFETCEPGKMFMEYCNECHCGSDGKRTSSMCTMMDCDLSVWNKNGTLKATVNVVKRSLSDDFTTCEPGKKFKEYCNTCSCGTDGLAVCTNMYCDPQIWNRDGTLKMNVEENQSTCEPGKTFKYYCNDCLCGPNGKVSESICTRQACNHDIWNQDGTLKVAVNVVKRSLSDDFETCEPGKMFMEYCNECHCGSDGKKTSSLCTMMDCDLSVWNKNGTLKATVNVVKRSLSDDFTTCEPGKKFKEYCNTCSCGTDGLAVCTNMYCDPQVWNRDGTLKMNVEENQSTCEPGKKFKYYCNDCLCGPNGKVTESICTRQACNHDIWNQDGTLKVAVNVVKRSLSDDFETCEPGKMFMEYCNECHCGSDGKKTSSMCTMMDCDLSVWNKNGTLKATVNVVKRSLSDDFTTCEPGKTFKEYCNTCSCGTDGLAVCTNMYCDPQVWNRDGTLKMNVEENQSTCEPGKTFKYYCNDCLCGPEGKVSESDCTRQACNHDIWNQDGTLKVAVNVVERSLSDDIKSCEPGKTFKEYCNTCSCGTNGVAVCTKMYCDRQVWNRDGTLKMNVEENQSTCEPGKTFKYYCNDCVCGPKGKVSESVCTRQACNHDIWNQDGTLKATINVVERSLSNDIKTCEPGKTFKEYCNTCSCGTNGVAVCTKMYCDRQVWNRDGTLKMNVEENQSTCEPGKTFKYYCNDCVCGPNGKVSASVCTRQACNHDIWNQDGTLKATINVVKRSLSNDIKTCEPGKTFKEYCNTCSCGTNGVAVCTKMYCDRQVWNRDGTLKMNVEENQGTCEPGKTFKYYCNDCVCGPKGKVSESVCTRQACNHDIWNQDGTLKATINVVERSLSNDIKTCEPGKTFKEYCNTCSCGTNGVAVCTKMYCDRQVWNRDGTLKMNVEENQSTCEPGKTFKYYCNDCVCGPKGKVSESVCTRRACNHDIWNENGTLKEPKGIVSDRSIREERSTNFLCQPGRVFKDQCNTCTCSKDGRSSVCTTMTCLPNNDRRIIAPKVCEPRKHFTIECNQCMCNGEGTEMACTKMACPI